MNKSTDKPKHTRLKRWKKLGSFWDREDQFFHLSKMKGIDQFLYDFPSTIELNTWTNLSMMDCRCFHRKGEPRMLMAVRVRMAPMSLPVTIKAVGDLNLVLLCQPSLKSRQRPHICAAIITPNIKILEKTISSFVSPSVNCQVPVNNSHTVHVTLVPVEQLFLEFYRE